MRRSCWYVDYQLSHIPPHPFQDVRDVDGEALEEGGEEDKSYAWGILQVGNDGAAEAVCPQVTMHVVLCLFKFKNNVRYWRLREKATYHKHCGGSVDGYGDMHVMYLRAGWFAVGLADSV